MKIIHIVHGKANPASANGISRVVYYLNKYERLAGIDSQIWAIVDGVKHHEMNLLLWNAFREFRCGVVKKS